MIVPNSEIPAIPEKNSEQEFARQSLPAELFWNHNLALLRSHYPELAHQIENSNCCHFEHHWRLEQTPSGNPTLFYRENNTAPEISIHSRRDPVREGQRQAEAALTEAMEKNKTNDKNGIIILLGFGLGYMAEVLAQHNSSLIIVERHKDLFTLALKSRNLERLISPGKAMFVLSSEPAAIHAALAFAETQKPLVIKNRALTGLTAEDESWYTDVERRINTWASKDEINAATLQRFGKRWTKNLAANMEGVLKFPGVKNLENILHHTDIPVFLAAAGPSLNNIEKHMKEIHSRCLTIAVDTSLRCLLKNGVEPDFIVSVDPQYWNALHLHRLEAPNTTLIAESAVYPSVLRNSAFMRVFFCQSLFPLGRFIEDRTDPKGILCAGGSVATTAWDFARFLGPSDVWIAGLDLAFPDYRTHYKGALFEENSHAVSKRFSPIETLSVRTLENGIPFMAASARGGKVLTDKRLSLYAAWFEHHIEQANVTNRSLSSDGLAIHGLVPAEHEYSTERTKVSEGSPLEKLLSLPERRKEINRLLTGLFSRIDAQFNHSSEKENRTSRYSDALTDLVRGLEEIRDRAGEAVSVAKNIPVQHRNNIQENEKILKKLDKTNAAIAASPVKAAAGFLFPPISELEKELQETDPFKQHLEFSRLFYQHLSESIDFTLRFIKKPINNGKKVVY
ncbi:MAG: DUF115 domain-containing protein [Treponema sp.]|nr:DUF115 domain-containing protein [Treponema sp.]